MNSKVRFILSSLVERVQEMSAEYIESWEVVGAWVREERREELEEVLVRVLEHHRRLSVWITEEMAGIKEQTTDNQKKSSSVVMTKLLVKEML